MIQRPLIELTSLSAQADQIMTEIGTGDISRSQSALLSKIHRDAAFAYQRAGIVIRLFNPDSPDTILESMTTQETEEPRWYQKLAICINPFDGLSCSSWIGGKARLTYHPNVRAALNDPKSGLSRARRTLQGLLEIEEKFDRLAQEAKKEKDIIRLQYLTERLTSIRGYAPRAIEFLTDLYRQTVNPAKSPYSGYYPFAGIETIQDKVLAWEKELEDAPFDFSLIEPGTTTVTVEVDPEIEAAEDPFSDH
jgi:hypothetical protein